MSLADTRDVVVDLKPTVRSDMDKTEHSCSTAFVQESFLKEMPVANTGTVETAEYVIHFCGLECYAEWMKRSGPDVPGDN
jgi:hypothetical protein